jgi:hypothetical protein
MLAGSHSDYAGYQHTLLAAVRDAQPVSVEALRAAQVAEREPAEGLPLRWVPRLVPRRFGKVSLLGDARSSLGDAESSLGGAESSLMLRARWVTDAKSSLGDGR